MLNIVRLKIKGSCGATTSLPKQLLILVLAREMLTNCCALFTFRVLSCVGGAAMYTDYNYNYCSINSTYFTACQEHVKGWSWLEYTRVP